MDLLLGSLTDWDIELNALQISQLKKYAALLGEYDLANVIGTRDRTKILLEHLLDSLSCFAIADLHQKGSLVDVGTGGGLPGIPLAIGRSDIKVTLLESKVKKVRFVEKARAALELQNLEVLHARAEEAASKPNYRETFEVATARALAKLPVVIELCAPLVRSGGAILAMKGQLSDEELSKGNAASGKLGLALRELRHVKYRGQFPQNERRIAVYDKLDKTPPGFPRRIGLANKRPLGG